MDLYAQQLQKKYQQLLTKEKKGEHTAPVVVVDMGCGEAKLAQFLYGGQFGDRAEVEKQLQILSLDLVARNEYITAANIADTKLPAYSTDIVIFCLSLMGTDYVRFLVEANRLLKSG